MMSVVRKVPHTHRAHQFELKQTTDKLKSEEKRKRIEENRIKYEVPEGVWSAIELPKPELVVSLTLLSPSIHSCS